MAAASSSSSSAVLMYRGEAFRQLIEGMRTMIERQASRLLAKGRTLPGVRVREYIDAQGAPVVRKALERLMGSRKWRYVSFYEFRETLTGVAKRLFDEVGIGHGGGGGERDNKAAADAETDEAGAGEVCFVVDSLRKSSFWVVATALLAVPPRSWKCLSMAVDDDGAPGGLLSAFGDLMKASARDRERDRERDRGRTQTRLVLMDDATYSGDQLSYFHDVVVDAWQEASEIATAGVVGMKAAKGSAAAAPHVYVAVPFMSKPSIPLFKDRRGRLTHLMYAESFSSLFHRRTLSSVLASDVYLLRESAILAEYQSLYFDFLGVLPTNTLVIFEHKVADSLSIPNRWLQLGPCLRPPEVAHHQNAFCVRPDKVVELTALLRRDLRERRRGASWGGVNENGPGTPPQRILLAASRRVGELMQSPRFRAEYARPVSLAADRPSPPAFFPLIPPEFCDPRYRRFVMTRLRRASSSASAITVADEMPPCRRPPYKRSSFRRRLNKRFLAP